MRRQLSPAADIASDRLWQLKCQIGDLSGCSNWLRLLDHVVGAAEQRESNGPTRSGRQPRHRRFGIALGSSGVGRAPSLTPRLLAGRGRGPRKIRLLRGKGKSWTADRMSGEAGGGFTASDRSPPEGEKAKKFQFRNACFPLGPKSNFGHPITKQPALAPSPQL
jgi:hypothetical protein